MPRIALIVLAALLWPVSALAQFQFFPLIQAVSTNSSGTTTCTFPRPVTSGNLLVVTESNITSTVGYTISDTLSSTWTQLQLSTANPVKTYINAAYAASSGSDTVTVSATSIAWQNYTCMEFLPFWDITVDAVNTATWSGGGLVNSPSITTTLKNDLVIAYLGGFNNTGCGLQHSYPTYYSAGNTEFADCATTAFAYGTGVGATNGSFQTFGSSGTVTTVALKSKALSINSPSTAADGSLSNFYSFPLLASGGNASYTWSITSGALQSGLSLNTSTGLISGTPSVSTSNNITFQVTDGTTTTSKAITLKIGATPLTVTVVQTNTGGFPYLGTISFVSNVTINNSLIVTVSQAASNTSTGGVGCNDTRGTQYRTIGTAQEAEDGTATASAVWILIGTAPSTGSNTVTCNGNTDSIMELSGITYAGFDNGANGNGVSAASPETRNVSLTTVMDNELIIASGRGGANSGFTIALQSPFTVLISDIMSTGYRVAGAFGSYTASWVLTTNTGNGYVLCMAGIRPAASAPLPPSGGRAKSQIL